MHTGSGEVERPRARPMDQSAARRYSSCYSCTLYKSCHGEYVVLRYIDRLYKLIFSAFYSTARVEQLY